MVDGAGEEGAGKVDSKMAKPKKKPSARRSGSRARERPPVVDRVRHIAELMSAGRWSAKMALELADTNGSLYQLLIQVGMQRMSVNYDMTGETVAAYLEPMAMQVHDTDACMAMPESSSAPTPSPTASN